RERRRPQELAGVSIVNPYAAALADRDDDVAFGAALELRADPLHVLGIGIDDGADQHLLLVDVHVPVIARQMLVVPDELARIDVERDRGVAVEVRGRVPRYRLVIAAVPVRARIGHRIRDAPVHDPALGIVGARQSPRRRAPFARRRAAPRLVAGLAGAGRGIEAPDLLARPRVVRDDVALFTRAVARAARDHLAVRHDRA